MKISLFLFCYLIFWDLCAQSVSFTDNTHMLQYIYGTMGQAKCAVDMNGDGLDDITRVSKNGLYIDFQKEEGTFLHSFIPLDIEVLPVWSITAGDLDNNGLNDLVFGGNSNVSFLLAQNNGDDYIEFKMPDNIFSQRGTLFDIDLDGDLDAFICRDDGQSQTFRNPGAGNMILDQSLLNTSILPGNYSAIWTDYNNDGNTDLYLSKCLGTGLPGNPARTNLLYRNNGDGTFTEAGTTARLNDNAQSWSTVFEDLDNDGDMDAFIINHDEGNRLLQNNGAGVYTNIISGSGIDEFDLGAWENASGDFNNDGFVDIISELKNELYLNNGDMTFTGHSLPFRPGAIGDFNNDGFLDVTYRSQLWTNDGNGNHWFKLNLRGIESNRNGIGARVELHGPWGVQIRELRAGQSYSPMNTLSVHFGIGQTEIIDKLIIKWPSGLVTEILNPSIDTTYNVAESQCIRQVDLIEISGKTELCPGDTAFLKAPTGYAQFLWSNGSVNSAISITAPGRFDVILTDSTGCSGVSSPVIITMADQQVPSIEILSGNETACQGTPVILQSSAGKNSLWSDGSKDTSRISVMSSGIFTVATDSVCNSGKLVSLPFEINFLDASPPYIADTLVTSGDSLLLNAEGENCAWFDSPVGGQLIALGCEFQTAPIFTDTIYYVESHHQYPDDIQSGGKPDTSGFNILSSFEKELHFTVWEPFTLLTTDIYLNDQMAEGERTFSLYSSQGLLEERTSYLFNGKNTVTLDFQVPAGSFTLKCDRVDQFQNVGALDYPYPIGDAGQIDSSSMGLNFYPYFFNWKIQKNDLTCISARTAVTIDVLTANKEVSGTLALRIFPVPASTILNISLPYTPDLSGELLVFDISGRLLLRQALQHSANQSLCTEHLPSGLYQLVFNSSPAFATKRFVVHK